MAVPSPTNTVVGGPLTLTASEPVKGVVCTDTGTYDPPATARQWQVNGVAVNGATVTPKTVQFCAAGTYPVRVRVTNADGSGNGSAVNVVVTDGVPAALPGFMTGVGVAQRIDPTQLPNEFKDATVATPGLPTAQTIANARLYNSVLPSANRVNVVVDGVGQRITL
jgi:hypothetical protein